MTSEDAPNSADHRENPSFFVDNLPLPTTISVIRQLFHGKILPLATLREVIARDIFKKVGKLGAADAPVVDSEVW